MAAVGLCRGKEVVWQRWVCAVGRRWCGSGGCVPWEGGGVAAVGVWRMGPGGDIDLLYALSPRAALDLRDEALCEVTL